MSARSGEAYRRLWQAVIHRAALDAKWDGTENDTEETTEVRSRERAVSLRWFRGDTEGFRLICEAAGMDPATLRKWARKKFRSALDAD